MRKAVDLVVEEASAIPAARAEAREQIWTPEQEAEKPPAELWTPSS